MNFLVSYMMKKKPIVIDLRRKETGIVDKRFDGDVWSRNIISTVCRRKESNLTVEISNFRFKSTLSYNIGQKFGSKVDFFLIS